VENKLAGKLCPMAKHLIVTAGTGSSLNIEKVSSRDSKIEKVSSC